MGLFSFFKTKQWNNEPDQQQLATLLREAAIASVRGEGVLKRDKDYEILRFLGNWKRGEARDRIVHAVSMVKITESAEVYEHAKEIGEAHYTSRV